MFMSPHLRAGLQFFGLEEAQRVNLGTASVAFGGHDAFFGGVGSWMGPVA